MNHSRNYIKVASDMFFAQGMWAMGFMGVMLIIQIVKIVSSFFVDSSLSTYYVATYTASNIFMLVIGIISAYGFVPYFVGHGVTRKDYFRGTILGTIGLALAIPIVSAIVSSLLNILLKLLSIQVKFTPFDGSKVIEEDHKIGDLILSIIFGPYVDLSSNWLLAILTFALNLFTYYIAGWLIGSAFSRLGGFGIISILVAYMLIFIEDLFLSISLGLPVPSFAESLEAPDILLLLGIALAIGLVCWFIRQLTKRMVVKV